MSTPERQASFLKVFVLEYADIPNEDLHVKKDLHLIFG